jgi:hypothetical protein
MEIDKATEIHSPKTVKIFEIFIVILVHSFLALIVRKIDDQNESNLFKLKLQTLKLFYKMDQA